MKSLADSPARSWLLSLILIVFALPTINAFAQSFFIGGYGEGIYTSTLSADGQMSEPQLAMKQKNPSFFAIHPKLDFLYVVTETNRKDSNSPAAISSYRFDSSQFVSAKTPGLVFVNTQKIDGDDPCHVSIDSTGLFLAVANYSSGSIVVYPIAPDGSIGQASSKVDHAVHEPNKQQPVKAHAHCTLWMDNHFLLVTDLGMDKVFVYDLNRETGKLSLASAMQLAKGSGPRHLSVHPSGQWVYIINERNMTLTAATWKAPQLTELGTVSTLPTDAKGTDFSTAEVLVHPNGNFVYGSNRGHNTIGSFKVDAHSGKLAAIGHTSSNGKTPRNFRITQKGDFLLAENQQSDSIYSFRINEKTGELTSTGYSVKAPAPACIKFLDR